MNNLISELRSFNRKERYHLVKYATSGNAQEDTGFNLSPDFKKALQDELKISIPDNAYAAMDYHLDWLYASLILTFDYKGTGDKYTRDKDCVSGNQEDIDFIIAFEDKDSLYNIILIEAKADTAWNNDQMESKCEKRLLKIFSPDAPWREKVQPYLVLTAPCDTPPQRLRYERWPKWMIKNNNEPYYMRLPISTAFKYITRCNGDLSPNKDGNYWKITC